MKNIILTTTFFLMGLLSCNSKTTPIEITKPIEN